MAEQGSEQSKKQLGYRVDHSSIIMGPNDVVIWGGCQYGLPWLHDDEMKRSVTTRLDVFNLLSMEWSSVSTTGTPPAGALGYSTTTIGEVMYVFDGGRCDDGGACVHNDLYQLNIDDKVWRSIVCTNKPMKKHSCGFISYAYQGSDYVVAFGGEGSKQPPAKSQLHSKYTPDYIGKYSTNEVHIMNMSTSPGQWISPTITGSDRPLSISSFSLHLLPKSSNQAIMYGGWIVPEKNESQETSNDTYVLLLTNDTVKFTKLSPAAPCLSWYASTIISTSTQDHLLVLGGLGYDGGMLAECWILDPASEMWNQVSVPESVGGRWCHSVCSVTLNTNTVWIVVTGGTKKDYSFIEAADEVAMVVELAYNNNEWREQGVWDTTQKQQLLKRKSKHDEKTHQS